MKSVFVVIPSLTLSAPVKGAVALCNGLSNYFPVSLVSLKNDAVSGGLEIDPRVKIVSLADNRNWYKKYKTYRRILKESGDRKKPVSISFCFSGDVFNSFFASYAYIISSVRGNLPRNYRIEFGYMGGGAAFLHFLLLKRFDEVIVMSSSMDKQLRSAGINRVKTIGNFLDEKMLEKKREQQEKENGIFRFIFLGRLAKLKRPELPVLAAASLRNNGISFLMEFVGDGPMQNELEELIMKLDLNSYVVFHGHQADPYKLLQRSDCLVLPSSTEGISRAVLEALFFGVPCIVSDVDGNRELITPGINGDLFTCDSELADVMSRMIQNGIKNKIKKNLLPDDFRQEKNIKHFVALINQ